MQKVILKFLIISCLFNINLLYGWGNAAPEIQKPTDEDSWQTDFNENNTSKITTIEASDEEDDDSEDDNVTYSIDDDSEDGDDFNIDEDSGDLTFKTTPDYEDPKDNDEDNEYKLTVIATDSDGATDSLDITINVTDEDDPKASIEDNEITETNGDQTLTFKIKLDSTSGNDVTIDWSLDDDTALDGEDYIKDNGSVTIASGDTEATFDVTIKGDEIDENNTEVFSITISSNDVDMKDSDGNGTIKDDDGTNCTKSGTIDLEMKDNYGDAEQQGDDVDHGSSDLEMMFDSDNEQRIGIVFEGVDIEQGCYVKNAYIQFTAKEATKETTSLLIYGEDEDNASNYADDRKVTDATKTDDVVKWTNIKEWDDLQSDEDTRTPQISCLAETILKRENWEQNNTMGFIVYPADGCDDSDCNRRAYSGSSDDYKAILHIEYSDNKDDSTPCKIAVDDDYNVRMGDISELNVTENDADGIDDDSVKVKTEPSHGTYEIDNSIIIYTPDNGFKGDDNLTYTVTVNGDESEEAIVSLHVKPVAGDVKFHIINPKDTRNIQGDFYIGGNMSLCVADDEDSECKSQEGTNDVYLKYIDIDDDDTTYNSSSFTLDVPDESEVIWAGLFWGGFIHNSDEDGSQCDDDGNSDDDDWRFGDKISGVDHAASSGCGIDLSEDQYDTDKVKFKHPKDDNYLDVNATAIYFSGYGFSSYANITYIFEDNDDLRTDPNGEYTLANLSTNHTKMKEHGNSGGWSLVVIYHNKNLDFKNVTVYHGWKTVDQDHSVDVNVSGFLVPQTNEEVKAKLSFISHDGDGGDCYFKLNDEKLGIWTDEAGNEHDDRDSVFNSTIIGVPHKNPDFDLTDDTDDEYSSFEIDTYDANGILESGDTTANIKLEMSSNAAFEVPLVIFSADMYTPKFCYDYTYKQGDEYFTEDNNGTQEPRIIGEVDNSQSIDVELYIRNNEKSDLQAVDFTVDIFDINTSQAVYERNTTWITQPNSTKRVSLNDDDLNVSDEYDRNISVNDVDSQDYFYLGYSLDVADDVDDVNMSLDVTAKYNLILDDEKIVLPAIHLGGKRIPICSSSDEYSAKKGIFNIVHNDYYDINDENHHYYNIPTQVASRVGNFKIISLEDDSEDLKDVTTIVGVEMVDIDSFHDVQANCDEINNTLNGQRLWVTFDNDTNNIDFDNSVVSDDFYKNASKNTAFRISFNTDTNGSLLTLKNDGDNYIIQDYNNTIAPNDDDCLDGSSQSVEDACGDEDDSISKDKLIGCMECIFGRHSKNVCSRDNFAIRPEAFLLKVNDINQTGNEAIRIGDDVSGVSDPSGEVLHLASGYKYNIEINATNHKDNNAAPKYYNTLNLKLAWNGSGSGCNDEANETYPLDLYRGNIDRNISRDNVGEYNITMIDKSWTKVDQVPIMHHKDDGNFTDENQSDCIKDSSVVADSGADGDDNKPLNGCNTSSVHDNSDADLKYRDYQIVLHPYKFTFNTSASVGKDNDDLDENSTLYISNIYNSKQSREVSFHVLDGSIKAVGYNDSKLVNFVKDCYAEDLTFNLTSSNRNIDGIDYVYMIKNKDNASLESNGTLNDNETINISKDNFLKDLNGTTNVTIDLNYKRDNSKAINPKFVTYSGFDINSSISMKADLDEHGLDYTFDLNGKIKYLYARTNIPRHIFQDNEKQEVSIYYEVYCSGSDCNKTLLPDGNKSIYIDDPRWFVTTKHTSSFGTAGDINQKSFNVGDGEVTQDVAPNGNHKDTAKISYDETRGYPFKTTMENNASNWLIYNKYNSNATKNEFEVEFFNKNSRWGGNSQTNTTTRSSGSATTTRRTIW